MQKTAETIYKICKLEYNRRTGKNKKYIGGDVNNEEKLKQKVNTIFLCASYGNKPIAKFLIC